jgi:MoxR-like ATPase
MEQIAKEMGYEPVIINCTNSTVYEDIVGYVTIMGDNYTGKV